MKVLNIKLYSKYKGHPIHLKNMFPNYIGVAEGLPIIEFKIEEIKEYSKIFPHGIYKKL